MIAGAALLVGLGGGLMRPYDEGLYGKLARNALEHGRYLYAVGSDGELYEGFSKPPLTILLVAASFDALGVSLTALRLPFALSMLATIGVAFAWGRRIGGQLDGQLGGQLGGQLDGQLGGQLGGTPFGVAWAGALLTCTAAFRWGRVACIEPMLMLWVLTGLWAYHQAMGRRGRAGIAWALLSALALCLAVGTKQVVVGLAMIPIVVLELWRLRWREALPRLLLVLGLPTLVGLAWLRAVAGAVGEAAFEIYFDVGVVERVEGYRSGTSMRSLNELSGVVAEACEPFAWVLGAVGLVVLVLTRPPARGRADGALLLPLLLLVTVLVFDNASSSMRPWYAYNLVVPLSAGLGFLVAGLVAPGGDRLGIARATGGAMVLAVGAVGSLADVTSQLNVVVLVGLLVVLAWRGGSPGSRWVRARVVLLAAGVLALGVGIATRPELRTPPGGHERLMTILAARGIERVHVDNDTKLGSQHAWGTYYGPKADLIAQPPWRTRREADAYVTGVIWPTEFRPPSGVEVVHVPGVMAVIGDVERAPWDGSTLGVLLDQGPLTFEAEHLPSQRVDVVVDDPQASGGYASAVVVGSGRPQDAFLLSHGPGVRLPPGPYTAEFMLRYGCQGVVERLALVLQVIAGRKSVRRVELQCPEQEANDYEAVAVKFSLESAARVELRVKYAFGDVWFDRVVVRRR
ncbi:MAG: phospholipid carrier-dependent glycosyltransferase [Myxococcota bacterium]